MALVRPLWKALLVASILIIPLDIVALDGLASNGHSLAGLWVQRLTPAERVQAATHIGALPVVYRRALISSLQPEQVAQVWKHVAQDYLDEHPRLAVDQRQLIQQLIAVTSPDNFGTRRTERLLLLRNVEQRITMRIGKVAASELLYTAGAVGTGSIASLPLRVQAAEAIRRLLVVEAREGKCNCAAGLGTECSQNETCSITPGCDIVFNSCGPQGMSDCDGTCRAS